MLVSASDWLKLIFEKVCGFAYIKITLSTNLDMHKRFQGSFCCDLPLQDLNLVSASGGMVTGWNSHQPKIFVFKSSSQKQNCRAHKKDQLCHQDQSSICLPLQDLNLVSASGGMVTGWNSHQPEIFVFKSSSQKQNCRAHKKGQLFHQDQPSTCLCSKVRDRAMTAF